MRSASIAVIVMDLLFSLRQIRTQPGLSAAMIVPLGLAIGANAAVFSFVNALLIRPFPFGNGAGRPKEWKTYRDLNAGDAAGYLRRLRSCGSSSTV